MSNKLALTKRLLDETPTVKEMFELAPVKHNWVATYEGTTGKPDGAMRFEAEVVNYMLLLQNNKRLAETSRFSQYNAFMELCLSGLSLRDGLACILPYKGAAAFQVMAAGRLEQIMEIPNVIFVQEPQLVYEEDEFVFSKGDTVKIETHIPARSRTNNTITHVYLHITFSHGKECYMMERDEILSIRDTYSQTYKSYIAKEKAGTLQGWEEVPMWIGNEGQAFKKTLIKRVWKSMKKLPKHLALDKRMEKYTNVPDLETEGLAETKPVPEFKEDEVNSVFIDDAENGYTAFEEVKEETKTEPEPKKAADKPKPVNKPKTAPAAAKPEEPKTEVKVEPLPPDIDPNESF